MIIQVVVNVEVPNDWIPPTTNSSKDLIDILDSTGVTEEITGRGVTEEITGRGDKIISALIITR